MKLSKVSLFAAVALAGAAVASAASAADSTFAFNAGIASDYLFRGIDQSGKGETLEVFGGADWTGGPDLYAGVWLSNTGPKNDRALEYDIYGGWKPKVGVVTLDLGAIYYAYTNSDNKVVSSDFNTLEFKAAGSVAAGPATLGAAIFYSPDFADTDESSWYYEINGSVPVASKVTLSGAVGQFKTDAFFSPDNYTTWNIGATFAITDHVSIDARYVGTDNNAEDLFGDLGANKLVGTLKATF
jgi:uncharacterized protein (TIGR02001 family)